MRKTLLRLLRIAPLALLFAGTAYAATGSIIGVVTDASNGKPVAGAVVIATSPNLQGEQTVVTESDGNFRFTLLPAGSYKLMVQLAGFKPGERVDIRLSADKTLRANLQVVPEAVTLEEQVVRTGLTPVVNVGSAETGSVVSRDFVSNVPVGRTFQAIATVAPQAAPDQYGVGFQGAQSPENGYIVDGLNITDPVYGAAPGTFSGRNAPTMLSNFIQEVDVKTGSFMPEYGRATGGIINVVTRSGSNEYHGEVWSNYRPDSLFQPKGKVVGADGEAVGYFTKPSAGSYNFDLGFDAGGPIMKDKLWFFAGFAPISQKTYYDRFQRTNVLLGDAGAPAVCNNTSATDTRCRNGDGLALWNKVQGSDVNVYNGQTSYQWAGKLSYLLNETNSFSLATYGQPSTQSTHGFARIQNANAQFETALDSYDVVGHYGGKFLDKRLILEGDLGWHGQAIKDNPNAFQNTRPLMIWNDTTLPGVAAYYSLNAFEPVAGCTDVLHCPVSGATGYRTGGFGFLNDQTLGRYVGKAAVGGLLNGAGAHSAKFGIDLERNYFDQSKSYSGGYAGTARGGSFRFNRGFGHLANGVSACVPAIPPSQPGSATSYSPSCLSDVLPQPVVKTTSKSDNFAYFAQDSWQVLNTGLTVNLGVRLETQEMTNPQSPDQKLKTSDSWAPRAQAIWDFTGTGRGKASASYGRFYWAIPLDMGDRAFGNEQQINFRQRFSCFPDIAAAAAASRYNPAGQAYGNFDPAKLVGAGGLPGCQNVNATTANGFAPQTAATGALFSQTGNPSQEPVAPGLQMSAVDMFGGQVEYEVLSDLSVGIEYAGRRQVRVVEDMSTDDGNTYFIANPGSGQTWTYQGVPYAAKNATSLDGATGRTFNVVFPKAQRDYDGLTFKVTKNYSRHWLAQASYTYSVLKGNYSGPSMPDYGGVGQGQLDPGITAAFDLASLLYNTKGLLPADHTHTVKLFGSYTWALGPRFSVTGGAGYTGQSGRPNSALGAHEVYGTGLGYIIQQGGAGRSDFTHQVDVRGSLAYVVRAPYELRFSVDVFNLLNQQAVLLYDQNYTFDFVQPIQSVKCDVQAVGKSNPVGVLQGACPDLKYLKTIDGRPITVNGNFGKPVASIYTYQTPIQVRFGLSLAF